MPQVIELEKLAIQCMEAKKYKEASLYLEDCFKLGHQGAELLHYHAVAQLQLGRLNQAASSAQKALQLQPRYPQALANLGEVYTLQGKLKQAIECLRFSLHYDPSSLIVHKKLAQLYNKCPEAEGAIESLYHLVLRCPNDPLTHSLFASLLGTYNCPEGALVVYKKVMKLQADRALPYANAGSTLFLLRRYQEAEQLLLKGLKKQKNHTYTRYNYAQLCLKTGKFTEGFKNIEARLNLPLYKQLHKKSGTLKGPLWQGEDLRGKTLLLYHEQGLGDNILACRFIPLLVEKGVKVIYRCPNTFYRLLSHNHEGYELSDIDDYGKLPAYDYQLPIWSLFHRLAIDPMSMGEAKAYLKASTSLAQEYKKKYFTHDKQSIGFVWNSNPKGFTAKGRSLNPYFLSPLFHFPKTRCYSLQQKVLDDERSLFKQFPLTDLSEDLLDLENTAALMENMDLIITIDTACAHLAGALGKKTFLLLPYHVDWKWTCGKVWYPNMEYFIQAEEGDWSSAIHEIFTKVASWQ